MNRSVLHVLGDEKIKKIHNASLEILSNTGVVMTHKKARELLCDHGAFVEEDRILIPKDLAMKCIKSCPKKVRFEGRDPKKAVELGSGQLHCHNVGGVPHLYVTEDERRNALINDLIDATILLDGLPDISCVVPFFTPDDIEDKRLMHLEMYYYTVCNTTKPVRGPGIENVHELNAIIEMAKLSSNEKSLVADISPQSPAIFTDKVIDVIFEAAEKNIPLNSLPCPIVGINTPMTLVGGLIVHNVELLASIIFAQIKNPGLPVIYRGRLSVLNPRTANDVWGDPTIGLMAAASVELGHYYNLPVNVYGFCTNSHTSDIQCTSERTINALMPILAGADEISGVGELDNGLSSTFAQMVRDDDLMKSFKRLKEGVKIDEDRMAIDLISEKMKGSRQFIDTDHTIKYLREKPEIITSPLGVRDDYEDWVANYKQGIVENARKKAYHLITRHKVPQLEEKNKKEMRKVIDCAKKQMYY
jgi:trimethylamine--corrinoid protein Co-methyltransferase